MDFQNLEVDCQNPVDNRNINRIFHVVECSIHRQTEEFRRCLAKATNLANLVNQAAANNAVHLRGGQRRATDALMGVLAEEGWFQYINSNFENLANYTEFNDPNAQIDLRLTNGETVEVRSSYIRNGLKFGLCHNIHNFKNIGPYSNSVKPGEIQKHLYLAVLFDQPKTALLNIDPITFYLIGGSTWNMMMTVGFDDPLTPYDALVPVQSNYRVVRFSNALDVQGTMQELTRMGYQQRG